MLSAIRAPLSSLLKTTCRRRAKLRCSRRSAAVTSGSPGATRNVSSSPESSYKVKDSTVSSFGASTSVTMPSTGEVGAASSAVPGVG